MSDQKKVFFANSFTNSDEDVVCLYDINYISNAKTPRFDIEKIANSEESPKIACKIHINNKTGKVFGIEYGIKPNSKPLELYKPQEIKEIVNSTEFIKGKTTTNEDYGRDIISQIISTTMSNINNKDKLRFIPPSIGKHADIMSNWIMELVKNNPDVKGLQCFRWGNKGVHVGLIAIDADKLRNNEIGSVVFFDSQGAFHDGSEKAIQNRYSQGETIINENGTINESSFLCNLYSIISDENKKGSNDYTEYTELNKEILKSVFGELSGFMEGFKEGVTLPVNMEPLLKCVGEKNGETDCSYWVETLYTIYCAGRIPNTNKKTTNDFENFKEFCKNAENINQLISAKETLKNSAKKAEELGLSIDISDYQKIMTQGGVRSIKQFKNPKLFSQIQDGNDQPTTATLKISEESKKVFKDIELIKITPKNYKEGQQLSSSELAEQIEKNGFTKEILENNNITIKRKNVEHFEPLRNFLLKNINKNLVGYNKGYSKEV